VHFAPANHGDNRSNEAGRREYFPFDEDFVPSRVTDRDQ
jgi:hypothetical protein